MLPGEDKKVRHAVSVTPNDSTVLNETDALYVGGDGDLAVVHLSGADVTYKAVKAGTLLPLAVTKVKSTGTTATLILACYA